MTTFRFVDTAGLRRPGKLTEDIEYYSRVRALAALEKAQVALILVDCTLGLTDYDLTIIDEAMKRSCAAALLLNKWDLQQLDLDDLKWKLARKTTLKPPFLATSARNRPRRQGHPAADPPSARALQRRTCSTRELNNFLQEIKGGALSRRSSAAAS